MHVFKNPNNDFSLNNFSFERRTKLEKDLSVASVKDIQKRKYEAPSWSSDDENEINVKGSYYSSRNKKTRCESNNKSNHKEKKDSRHKERSISKTKHNDRRRKSSPSPRRHYRR